jgi:hypothetical protein
MTLFKRHYTTTVIALGCSFSGIIYGQGYAVSRRVDLSNTVFVGDSLTAGYQNFSLLDSQQVHGFAAVIAQQAGLGQKFVLPLMAAPGVPPVLELDSSGNIVADPRPLPPLPRENPGVQPTDLAVPGMFLNDLLTKRPGAPEVSLVDALTDLVLGFPSPFIPGVPPGIPETQVEQAARLSPTTVIAWAGNNDVLFPELFGPGIFPITPIGDFQTSFNQLLDKLTATHATVVVGNIPDVTLIPYLTPAIKLAQQKNIPLSRVTSALGIGPADALRPSALPLADAILSGAMPGPLPAICPPPLPGPPPPTGFPPVPCVMSANDILQTKLTVLAYNAIIAISAFRHNATVVDIYSLVNRVAFAGIQVNGHNINLDFRNGFVSLDRMHPTNTGYGIIANEFIKTMNRQLDSDIPPASIEQIAKTDPLFPH